MHSLQTLVTTLQAVMCTFFIKHISLCPKNCARVAARPSFLCAGDAIYPVLQKGVVWFMTLDSCPARVGALH